MNTLKHIALCMGLVSAITILSPSHSSHAVVSNDHGNMHTFPMPQHKPYIDTKDIPHDAYLNKKQAAIAALGLYLGYKQATPPLIRSERR